MVDRCNEAHCRKNQDLAARWSLLGLSGGLFGGGGSTLYLASSKVVRSRVIRYARQKRGQGGSTWIRAEVPGTGTSGAKRRGQVEAAFFSFLFWPE